MYTRIKTAIYAVKPKIQAAKILAEETGSKAIVPITKIDAANDRSAAAIEQSEQYPHSELDKLPEQNTISELNNNAKIKRDATTEALELSAKEDNDGGLTDFLEDLQESVEEENAIVRALQIATGLGGGLGSYSVFGTNLFYPWLTPPSFLAGVRIAGEMMNESGVAEEVIQESSGTVTFPDKSGVPRDKEGELTHDGDTVNENSSQEAKDAALALATKDSNKMRLYEAGAKTTATDERMKDDLKVPMRRAQAHYQSRAEFAEASQAELLAMGAKKPTPQTPT